MSIYGLDETNNIIIVLLALMKFKDSNSLIKILTLLCAILSFEPITIKTDLVYSEIKSIKGVEIFKKNFIN